MVFNPSDSFRVLLVDPDGVAYSIGSGALGTFDPSNSARVVLVDIDGVPYKATGGGSGGTPGGAFNSVQFNNAGSFGGFGSWNGTTLQIPGAANNLNLAGSTTGNPVTLMATGSDTDVGILVTPKGIGNITLFGNVREGNAATDESLIINNFQVDGATPVGILNKVGGVSQVYTGLQVLSDAIASSGTTEIYGLLGRGRLTGSINYYGAVGVYAVSRAAGDGNIVGALRGVNSWAHNEASPSVNKVLAHDAFAESDFGSVGHATCFNGQIAVYGGTVADSHGLLILTPDISGGVVTTNYGVKINDQTGGSTNYSAWFGAGLYHFDVLTASNLVATDASKNLVSLPLTTYLTSATGVSSVAKSGSTALHGAVTFTGGSNVTLTQSGQDISIAASGGGTPGGSDTQVQFNDSSAFGGDAGLTYNKTTNVLTNTGGQFSLVGGTVTVSTPLIDATQTWNDGSVTFTGIKANITSTASAAASLLLDLQLAGASQLKVDKNSRLYVDAIQGATGATNYFDATTSLFRGSTGITIENTAAVLSLGGGNIKLITDATAILAQRNGANAQTFRVYGTFTDTGNYERASLSTQQGASITLAAETAGSGADDLDVIFTPAGTGKVRFGSFVALGVEVGAGTISIKDSGGTTRKLLVVA